MIGLLSTGLPIMFGLRQDMNEEFTHNTTDTTQGQLQLTHEQMAALQQQDSRRAKSTAHRAEFEPHMIAEVLMKRDMTLVPQDNSAPQICTAVDERGDQFLQIWATIISMNNK